MASSHCSWDVRTRTYRRERAAGVRRAPQCIHERPPCSGHVGGARGAQPPQLHDDGVLLPAAARAPRGEQRLRLQSRAEPRQAVSHASQLVNTRAGAGRGQQAAGRRPLTRQHCKSASPWCSRQSYQVGLTVLKLVSIHSQN